MASAETIAKRQHAALTELTTILERHDSEAAARLAKVSHGSGVPTSPKRPLENATYLAESMLILARVNDEHVTPKKRGRPRKDVGSYTLTMQGPVCRGRHYTS